MAKSDEVRASVIGTLLRRAQTQKTARALDEGRRDVIKSGVVRDDELQRACQAITRKLGREHGWVPGKIGRQAIVTSLRHYFEEAVDKLEEAGQIEVERVDGNGRKGLRLRLKAGAR